MSEDASAVSGSVMEVPAVVPVTGVPDASVVPAVPAPREFLLTVRVKFKAADNLEARQKAVDRLVNMQMAEPLTKRPVLFPEGEEIKLQEVFIKGPPVKIEI